MRIPVMRSVIDRRILVNFTWTRRCSAAFALAVSAEKSRRARHGRHLPDSAQASAAAGRAGVSGHRVGERRPSQRRRMGRSRHAARRGLRAAARHQLPAQLLGRRPTLPRHPPSRRLHGQRDGRPIQRRTQERSTASPACRCTASRTAQLPSASVFGSLAEASAFFQAGSLGYSATPERHAFRAWNCAARAGTSNRSKSRRCVPAFSMTGAFPPGSIAFDSAL